MPFRLLSGLQCVILCTVSLLTAPAVCAQDDEVPRTRTLPGIESPAFPYAEPEEVGLSSEKLARLGDEITEWVAGGELVGAELLIVKDGRAVFHEAYGWSDREERRPVERNSIWSIKSMSKPFAAAAILMLEEEGRLSLDDQVNRYIPGFAGDERTTIHHLLTHTSGYEGLGFNIGSSVTLGEWVADWAEDSPTQPFGAYSYSDFNYAALGYIVEAVSGVAADAFIEERIIRPLGLDETYTTFWPEAPWAARVNSRYRWNEEAGDYEKYWTHRGGQGWAFYPAAWGLWATAMDYAEFMTMWMNKGRYEGVRLLSEETVEEALRAHASRAAVAYGYGWTIKEAPRSDGMPFVFAHGGFDGTLALAFPGSHAMVILLTHSRGGGHHDALVNRLGTVEVFDQPGPYSRNLVWAGDREVAEAELEPEERARYVGAYRGRNANAGDAPERLVRVWAEGGRLHARVGELGERAGWRLHLVPLGDHRFAMGRYRGERLEAISPSTLRFMVEDGGAKALEVVRENEILFSAERADPDQLRADIDRLLAERAAARNRVSVADVVLETLEAEGIEAAWSLHRTLRAAEPDSVRFGESLLNTLGYRLLSEERIQEAIAVFEMNVEAYPEAWNPHDSLGDAYRAAGEREKAAASYRRAVDLNPDGPSLDKLPPPELAGSQTALRDTILSLSNDLAASWSQLEPEDFLARFSDDLIFYIQGSRLSRDDFTRAVREIMGSVRESSFEVLDPEVEVLGPDAAVISFQWSETTRDADGSTADQTGAITLVYERREGEWLVVRAHESLRPAR